VVASDAVTATPVSAVHVIALVKGTFEGDPYAHFGSLLGFEDYAAAARQLGLIDGEGKLTSRGLDLYYDGGLRSLPSGRANDWSADAPEALAIAVRMLEDWRRP